MEQSGEQPYEYLQYTKVVQQRGEGRKEDDDRQHLEHEDETDRAGLTWTCCQWSEQETRATL